MIVWQVIAIFALAPLLQGWVKTLKARMQGRHGPSVLQPYRDLRKQFHKSTVFSGSASFVTRLGPYVIAGLLAAACAMLPVSAASSTYLAGGSIFAFLYVLAFVRAATVLLGLDSGSAFAGMGASRDLLFAILAEPAVFLALLALGMPHASFSFPSLAQAMPAPGSFVVPAKALASVALFLVILAETGRLPVDNPDTHLELTMVHEGMLLELTGRHLALVTWSAYVRQLLWFTVLIDTCLPWGMAGGAGIGAFFPGVFWWLAKCLALGALVAGVESVSAKLRIFAVPRYLSFALALSAAAVLVTAVL